MGYDVIIVLVKVSLMQVRGIVSPATVVVTLAQCAEIRVCIQTTNTIYIIS